MSINYDGTNPEQVLAALQQSSNPPLKGGVELQPPTPGAPLTITVELADGTIQTITQGQQITVTAAP